MANLGDILAIPAPAATPVVSGDGLGGGLTSGLILASLLGRGGLGVGTDYRGTADSSTVASIIAAITANETLSEIGDIKASVPLAEGQVQLALAQAVQQLTTQHNAALSTLSQGQTNILLTNATNQALVARDLAAVNTNVDRANLTLLAAIKDDGDKTRSILQAIDKANDTRLITIQADKIIELENESRRQTDRHGVEVTMINNQNQNQIQLNQLAHGISDALQSIRATNQAINIGAGTLTAAPVNTNTNVRA